MSGSNGPGLAGFGLALPVIERATPGAEEAEAPEPGWACRIGNTSANFARIGIFDDLRPKHRRNAKIDERFVCRDIDHLVRMRGAGWQRDPIPRSHRDTRIPDPRL